MFTVTWTLKIERLRKNRPGEFVYKSYYEVKETREEARALYLEKLELDDLYTAAYSGIIESTDHDPA